MHHPQFAEPLPAEVEVVNEYLERVLASERFRKAPSLRHLLHYLVNKTLQGEQDQIKETVVAIDVFDRRPDFDGRIDNIVRVHAHRLRKLLEGYYLGEGASDAIRFSIPKGSYVPQVHRVGAETELATSLVAVPDTTSDPLIAVPVRNLETLPDAAVTPGVHRFALWTPGIPHFASLLCAFLAGSLAIFCILLWTDRITTSPQHGRRGADNLLKAPLSTLWKNILSPGANCVVSFTNPVFLWAETQRSRLYMTYRGPVTVPLGTQLNIAPGDPYIDPEIGERSGPFFFSDSWTGTGEVMAVHRLTGLLSEAGIPLRVIRSRALTYADMKGANVIFLGSPWANEMQEKFNIGTTPLVCEGYEGIRNNDPRPGEPRFFGSILDPKTRQLTASYGLFSVLPGVSPGTKIVISAGINTYATAAAIEYVTSAAGVRELVRRFGAAGVNPLPEFFQAVIRTEIIKGEPANSALVLVRSVSPKI